MIIVHLHNCHLPDKEQREERIERYLTRRFNQSAEDLLDCFNNEYRDRYKRIYNRAMRVGKRGSYRKANKLWDFTWQLT